MRIRIQITGGSCILAALMLLVLPLKWVAGAVLAGAFHELCHLLAVIFTGGQVYEITIGAGGTRMETSPMSSGRELVCALAGPLGSFLLVSLHRWFPVTAVCALIQGIYNLIPLFPMDGGRALRAALSLLLSENQAAKINSLIKNLTVLGLICLSIMMSVWWKLGIAPVLWCIFLLHQNVFRKNFLQRRSSRSTIGLPFIMR